MGILGDAHFRGKLVAGAHFGLKWTNKGKYIELNLLAAN